MLTVPDSIKDLLHLDSCKKNIRIHFPNGEREDICNDLIVKDSVSFTESICSQNSLKFGICESPVFECEVVGVSNIIGAAIEVSCEVYCDSSVSGAEWKIDLEHYVYSLPYGTFFVQKCPRQADMIHRKITAYNANFYLTNTNEIMNLVYNIPKSSSWTYTPNIFAANMCLSNFTGMSRGLTYNHLSVIYDDDMYVPVAVSDIVVTPLSNVRKRYAIFAICKAIWAGQDIDDLAYCTYPRPNKSVDEIRDLIIGDHPTVDQRYFASLFTEWAKTSPWDKCGAAVNYNDYVSAIVTPTNDWVNCVADKLVGFTNGHYVYVYKNDTTHQLGGQYVLYTIVPYGIDFGIINADVSPYTPDFIYTPILYRDKDEIDFYSVHGFPEFSLSFSTKKKKKKNYYGLTESWWYIDQTEIDFISAFTDSIELSGQLGSVDHYNAFNLINLQQQFGLNPSETLYPSSSLHPEGVTGGKLLPQDYQSCWYDDAYTMQYGMVQCEYKNTSDEDCVYYLYLTGYDKTTPRSTYAVYDISSNKIIKDKKWTEAQITTICNTIAANLEGVTYMPVEFVGRGLPYVEAGDTFEILTASNDSITTIVLNRTLSGEQVLTDSYKSV